MNYLHLNINDRLYIEECYKLKISISEIARRMNRSKSTIWREINRCKRVYNSYQAHLQYKKKRLRSRRKLIVKTDVINYIRKNLLLFWSPEQIVGWYEHRCQEKLGISISTIYRYIKKKIFQLHPKYLRNFNSNKKRSCGPLRYKNSKYIGDFPRNKDEFGHWEMDTIVGLNHQSAKLTLTEKLTNYSCVVYLEQNSSEEIYKNLMEIFNNEKFKNSFKTITTDNGSEFACWEKIEKTTGCPIYFAKPGRPWEKGSIEHTNKLLRQYYPKKTDLKKFDKQHDELVTAYLNNRPRKKLGFKTPSQIFREYITP